ncbi:hypothetical protein OPT61_g3313 [Boeremia exigua]|uniref:Uncharacterized protein n=1 Tax=Boeremia exigua TaxID=749465 RepID=A0ACC2IID4_9PLEO|nr:hypothetical protein OPT61_g3313 [Boeremia exigua]
MIAVRFLALAAVTGARVAANGMNNDSPRGEVIEMLPRAAGDGTCAELPKLCTGPVMMYGYATTVTYLCPETTKVREPSTVHVTITKTTTVTPSKVESTDGPTATPGLVTPAPVVSEEPDTTTTIHSTLTRYTTITLYRSSHLPLDATPAPALSITGYLSATIPTELVPSTAETNEPRYTVQTSIPPAVPSTAETDEPLYTVQTSIPPAVTSSSDHDFPTMTPPVFNGTTTGIFFSASVANSSLVQPTAFFPNTTAARSHYAVPTLNVENRAAFNQDEVKNAAEKFGTSIVAITFIVAAMAVAI